MLLGKVAFNASSYLVFLMWLIFVHLLILEKLFYKSGAVCSSALIRSMAEGNAGAGGISGAVVSLKWAGPHSCLFVPCRLGFRPKQLERVMLRNVLRDPQKNHRMMSCDGLPGLRCCPWPTSCVQTRCGRMLELRVKKSFFPWGRKSRSPLLFLPNYGYKIHTHSLSEFRKHGFVSCFTVDKGYEVTAASAGPIFVTL